MEKRCKGYVLCFLVAQIGYEKGSLEGCLGQKRDFPEKSLFVIM
jgi:hypothetical protein